MINFDNLQQIQSESSSKGNQLKFYNNSLWYKLDSPYCYQGLAEEFISYIESCIMNFSYVQYQAIKGYCKDEEVRGCYCQNMYSSTTQFISFRNILRNKGISSNIFIKYDNTADNIKAVVETLYNLTGLNLLEYLKNILFLDALIINEDRHWMNLGICLTNNKYHVAPCFDNGSSLFCVNWTYRKRKSFEENIEFAKTSARPFSKFYDKQINALLSLGCSPLVIDINRLQQVINQYNNVNYDKEQVNLIKKVLINRLNYYKDVIYVRK